MIAGGQLDENTAARFEAATLVNSLPAWKKPGADGSNPWTDALRSSLEPESRFGPRKKNRPKSRRLLYLAATWQVIEIQNL